MTWHCPLKVTKKRKNAETQAEVSSQFSVSGEDLTSEENYDTEDSSEDDNSDSDDSLYVPSDCEDCSGGSKYWGEQNETICW